MKIYSYTIKLKHIHYHPIIIANTLQFFGLLSSHSFQISFLRKYHPCSLFYQNSSYLLSYTFVLQFRVVFCSLGNHYSSFFRTVHLALVFVLNIQLLELVLSTLYISIHLLFKTSSLVLSHSPKSHFYFQSLASSLCSDTQN